MISDEELLKLVSDERRASIGFENDEVLATARERALTYYKGEMRDVPALANRSRAVSTDVADAVDTLLPDLVEIFTGSDEVAAFAPTGAEDEAAAAQETDYVNHVVMRENDGFLLLYTAFNQGPARARRFAAEAAEGPVRRRIETVRRLREAHYRSLPAFAAFGRGWLRRLSAASEAAASLAEEA